MVTTLKTDGKSAKIMKTIYVTKPINEELKRLAKNSNLSISGQIEYIIQNFLDKEVKQDDQEENQEAKDLEAQDKQ